MEQYSAASDIAMVQVSVAEAIQLCVTAFQKAGYSTDDAEMITEHLVDAELRGSPNAGLARALSIVERLQNSCETRSSGKIEVVREGAAFARLDGHDAVGYLVAHRATKLAIEKAKAAGVAVVGANNFWYSGNLAYYAEMATKQDLVCILVSNTAPLVAPEGGFEARFGTNPICIGFPTSNRDRPVIWDIGTSNVMHAQIMRAHRLGIVLPEGAAYSKDGQPSTYIHDALETGPIPEDVRTTDPTAAVEGVMKVWGGHKGSGLAVMIQLLGMAAGSSAIPSELHDFGYLALMFDPAVLRPIGEVKKEADEYGEFLRSAKTLSTGGRVRMPFDGSYERRKATVERGSLGVPKLLVEQLRKMGFDC